VTEEEFRALKPGDVIEMLSIGHNSRWEVVAPKKWPDGAIGYEIQCVLADKSHEVGRIGGASWPDGWGLVSNSGNEATRLVPVIGYEPLASVLDEALAQAQAGKGKERHANGEPYDEQKIVTLNLQIGSEHGAIFQGCKKAQESARLDAERGDAELLGAINYLAAAVIIRRKLRAKKAP